MEVLQVTCYNGSADQHEEPDYDSAYRVAKQISSGKVSVRYLHTNGLSAIFGVENKNLAQSEVLDSSRHPKTDDLAS